MQMLLVLEKQQVKQGGTTPTAVKYQGMSYKYNAKSAASKNKTLQFHSLKNLSLKQVKCTAFIAQYDNTTGSIYYKATVDGKELKLLKHLQQGST